ncbi:hypothetical protein [Streptomyces sp. NPDC101150]|uniref:hypothetical protein n=1 Tax=Streptomyces sp. NPDC101150 TaxID=3366114 RepID=UPI00380D63AF
MPEPDYDHVNADLFVWAEDGLVVMSVGETDAEDAATTFVLHAADAYHLAQTITVAAMKAEELLK